MYELVDPSKLQRYMKENEDTKAMILTLDQDLKEVRCHPPQIPWNPRINRIGGLAANDLPPQAI